MTTSHSEAQSQPSTVPTFWHLASIALILVLLSYGAGWLNSLNKGFVNFNNGIGVSKVR